MNHMTVPDYHDKRSPNYIRPKDHVKCNSCEEYFDEDEVVDGLCEYCREARRDFLEVIEQQNQEE